jgi:uncharacterized protein (UPF0548 family)
MTARYPGRAIGIHGWVGGAAGMQREMGRGSRSRRVASAAGWPVGVAWTMWRYMWRTTPVHRWELVGSRAEDAGPPLPQGIDLERIQREADGAGALFHRVYETSIRGSGLSAAELIAKIAGDLDALAPSELARFEKVRGEQGVLRAGDEYVVRLPGPWDGPVRVAAVEAESFRLVTLDGHLEAGQIEFRAYSTARSIEFTIESWARSGDRLSDLLYSRVRMSKEVQLHMWTSVLQRVVELARGRMDGGVRVLTRRVAAGEDEPSSRRDARRRSELHQRSVNFDPSEGEHTPETGWRVDDMAVRLPSEPSGEPIEGGSWLVARRLMHEYQVADPRRIRAVFDPQAPLEGRDMLLEIRYLGLRIDVGVRVGEPYDELRVVDGRRVRVYGWCYRTLEGHFEMGEMHYQVWKWLDDGEVEFRLHSYSRRARDGPWWQRAGFRVVGRRQQLSFYRGACRRMRRLTESQLHIAEVRRRRRLVIDAGGDESG